ncbi:MAG: hypothetical protein ACE5GV_00410 [Candidatus Scalindua sp.]
MSLAILPQEPEGALGGLFRGLGTGLQEGIKAFTDRRAIEKGLVEAGVEPEKARGVSRLHPEMQKLILGGAQGLPGREIAPILERLGLKEEKAGPLGELFQAVGPGGQTEVVRTAIDQLQRQGGHDKVEPTTQNADVEPNIDAQMPVVNNFEGLTPKEKVSRQSEFFKTNLPFIRENQKKLKSAAREGRSIEQLKRLNEGDKLPKGIGRFNVDFKKGELRIPAFANPETQLFVKTINEFVRKARDSFGARVTNFELTKFLQGLPTLANTTEGRRLILSQMDSMNKLNQLHADSLKEVYKHYGARNIDELQAEEIAEGLRSEKEERLIRDFFRAPQAQKIFEAKQQLPSNKILIEINGRIGTIPVSQQQQAIAQGADIL